MEDMKSLDKGSTFTLHILEIENFSHLGLGFILVNKDGPHTKTLCFFSNNFKDKYEMIIVIMY